MSTFSGYDKNDLVRYLCSPITRCLGHHAIVTMLEPFVIDIGIDETLNL